MKKLLKYNTLSKDQLDEIENMNISDRVTFIRDLLWNGLYFNDDYTEVRGLEDFGTSDKNMEHFLMGATAMFDFASMLAANHYHGHPDKNKVCEVENKYLMDVMESAFEYINPDLMVTWKKLKE